ncbi:MAG: hypothetical protein KDD53_03455 [Bdellovibrionales bacterium]|nr:hypothetical protein [Bdellovibrionales bacterium]
MKRDKDQRHRGRASASFLRLHSKMIGAGFIVWGIAVFCGFVYFCWANWPFELDDALIYQRYVRNLLNGHGLVFNENERFNALSSPLFTYLLLIGSLFAPSVHAAAMTLSVLSWLGLLFLTAALFGKRLSKMALFILFSMLVSSHYFYETFGLESLLSFALILLALFLYEKHYDFALGIVAALAILTRGENVLCFLVMLAEFYRSKREFPGPRVFIIPALLLGGHFIFHYWYFGSWMPATLFAKVAQGESGLWPKFWQVDHIFSRYIELLPGWFYVFATPLLLLGLKPLARFTAGRILMLYAVFYFVFYAALGIPAYGWYYVPIVYFVYLATVFGCYELDLFTRKLGRLTKGTIMTIGVLIYVFFIKAQVAFSYRALPVPPPSESYRSIGDWIAHNTPPGSKVASLEVGALGWYSDRYIVDILGVTSPYNAQYLAKRRFRKFLQRYSPDFILFHEPLWPQEISVRHLLKSGKYERVEEFPYTSFGLIMRRPEPSQVEPKKIRSRAEGLNHLQDEP